MEMVAGAAGMLWAVDRFVGRRRPLVVPHQSHDRTLRRSRVALSRPVARRIQRADFARARRGRGLGRRRRLARHAVSPKAMGKGRLEAFTDGVVAIIITIM